MSFRDVRAMLQCLFYVNDLPGGEAHHDGGMKGRDPQAVLSNRMLALTPDESARARCAPRSSRRGRSSRPRVRPRERRT